jgi:hypothetical protein
VPRLWIFLSSLQSEFFINLLGIHGASAREARLRHESILNPSPLATVLRGYSCDNLFTALR